MMQYILNKSIHDRTFLNDLNNYLNDNQFLYSLSIRNNQIFLQQNRSEHSNLFSLFLSHIYRMAKK